MIIMLEMICKIPEEIGWTMVGFAACLCCVMAIKLGKTVARAIAEWKSEEAE